MGKARDAARFLAPIFCQYKWQWHGVGVPSENDIVKTLKDLKRSARKVKGWSESGRLCARYDHDSKEVEYLLCIPGRSETT